MPNAAPDPTEGSMGASADADRVTDERSHEAASPPSGSVPTGAVPHGPWSFRYFMEPAGKNDDNFHLIEGPEGDQGSSILEGAFVFPGTHSDALKYAHLISAAPDLYSAAERALNYIANTEGELAITLESGVMLRAALAKARGEQP